MKFFLFLFIINLYTLFTLLLTCIFVEINQICNPDRRIFMSMATHNATQAVATTPAASSTSSSSTSAAKTVGIGSTGSSISSATPVATTESPSIFRRGFSAVSSLVSTIGSGIISTALYLGKGILYVIAMPFRAVKVLVGSKTAEQLLDEFIAKITKDLKSDKPDREQMLAEMKKLNEKIKYNPDASFKLFKFALDNDFTTDVVQLAKSFGNISTERSVELVQLLVKDYNLSAEQLLDIMVAHLTTKGTKIAFDKGFLDLIKDLIAKSKIKYEAEVGALVDAAVKIISNAPIKLSDEITGEFVQTVLGLRRLTEAQAKLLLMNIPLSEKNRNDATEKALKKFTNDEFARDITLNNESIEEWDKAGLLFIKFVNTNVARHVSEFAKKSQNKREIDDLLQGLMERNKLTAAEAHKLAAEIYGAAYTNASEANLVKLGKETYDKSGTLSRAVQTVGATLARQKEPEFYQGYALSHAAREAREIVKTAVNTASKVYLA